MRERERDGWLMVGEGQREERRADLKRDDSRVLVIRYKEIVED